MKDFLRDVKYNCDVSDARYWGSFSICGLLMRVRDLYRSEKSMDPWERIPQEEISLWLDYKEKVWQDLDKADYREIGIDGNSFDPFDIEGINAEMGRYGLVYGAGFGLYGKPTFLVADVSSLTAEMGHTVCVTGREHVRDIFASPGMSQGRRIFVRLWPLRALLWEKIAEVRAKSGSCLREILSGRGLLDPPGEDQGFRDRFNDLAEGYAKMVAAHELAESLEDVPGWPDLILAVGDRGAEYFLRATKDIIADTSDFGPLKRMIDYQDRESLCIFSELFGAYHRKLDPELSAAMKRSLEDSDWNRLDSQRIHTFRYFLTQRDCLLEAFRSSGDREEPMRKVRELICRYATPGK